MREYFNYLGRVLDAAGDLFALRYIENPPGNVLLKSYGQLLPGEIRGELMRSWDAEAKRSGEWKPAALFGGLSRIHVKEEIDCAAGGNPGRAKALPRGSR